MSNSSVPDPTENLDRYVRQMRYAPIGEAGQRRLAESHALVCGCGALGSMSRRCWRGPASASCESSIGTFSN